MVHLDPYVGVVHEERGAAVVVVEVVQQHQQSARGVRGGRAQQLGVQQLQQARRAQRQVRHVRLGWDAHLRHVHLERTVQDLSVQIRQMR